MKQRERIVIEMEPYDFGAGVVVGVPGKTGLCWARALDGDALADMSALELVREIQQGAERLARIEQRPAVIIASGACDNLLDSPLKVIGPGGAICRR
jgi:hypothetical protein